jgi:glycosyltransferase involved in cell wall biosynthesis
MIAIYVRELDIKGGTHKQLLYLVDYFERNDVKFKIITSSLDYNKTFDSFKSFESKIVCIKREQFYNVFKKIYSYFVFILELRKALKGIKILNIHDQGLQLIFPFIFDKKIIWQINDLPIEFIEKQNKTIFNNAKKFYVKICTKIFINKITVNVSKNKDRVLNCLGSKSEVLYCGIEKIDISKNLNHSLNRIKSKKLNILTSGVFIPYRNYETTIEVAYKLIEQGYDVNLKIIGSTFLNPIYAEKVQNHIRERKLENNITILGQVSEKMFLELHDDSDIFIFINIDQSWGLAVFEAMSCGIPVILSQSVGATEILENNIDCFFVDPINIDQIVEKILCLVNNSNKYTSFFYNGITFADNYTWDKAYSSNVLKLINELQ